MPNPTVKPQSNPYINPAHFDLQSLRVFLLVAESGSVAKASERVHMTPSAISKRVIELEKAINCALFLRLPRGMELTPAGLSLLEHARGVVIAVNRMACDMGDYAIGVRGHVRIWANTSAVIQFLPQDLAAFAQENPDICIALEERVSGDIVNAIVNAQADIGIFADNAPATMLHVIPYRLDELVVLVPLHHPLAELEEMAFADTLEYDYVGLTAGSSLLDLMVDAATATGRTLNVRIQVSSFDAICRMIESGLGIGILPRASVRTEILATGLSAIRLVDAWAQRRLWLGVRDPAALKPEAVKLLAFLSASHNQADLNWAAFDAKGSTAE